MQSYHHSQLRFLIHPHLMVCLLSPPDLPSGGGSAGDLPVPPSAHQHQ